MSIYAKGTALLAAGALAGGGAASAEAEKLGIEKGGSFENVPGSLFVAEGTPLDTTGSESGKTFTDDQAVEDVLSTTHKPVVGSVVRDNKHNKYKLKNVEVDDVTGYDENGKRTTIIYAERSKKGKDGKTVWALDSKKWTHEGNEAVKVESFTLKALTKATCDSIPRTRIAEKVMFVTKDEQTGKPEKHTKTHYLRLAYPKNDTGCTK